MKQAVVKYNIELEVDSNEPTLYEEFGLTESVSVINGKRLIKMRAQTFRQAEAAIDDILLADAEANIVSDGEYGFKCSSSKGSVKITPSSYHYGRVWGALKSVCDQAVRTLNIGILPSLPDKL